MLLESRYSVYNSIILFIFIIVLLYSFKPDFIYSRKLKKFKQFGIRSEETIFPFHIISITAGILSYFMFSMIDKLDKLVEK